jgi:aromatic-L-amino-acid/L-tryptophan decarboxylase
MIGGFGDDRASGTDALVPHPEAMRALGYRVVDRLVERWTDLEDDVPWRGASAADALALLDSRVPEEGEPLEGLIEEAVHGVLPLAGRIDHPRFFGFVPSAPGWPALMGDMLAAGFNVFQGTWLESAGPSAMELTVLEWFRGWLEMPEGSGGVLTSGGSAANLLAVVAAREAAGRPEWPVLYLSDQGHSSIRRGARIAGFPEEAVRTLPTDEGLRLGTETVRSALRQDRAQGLTPVLVCANGGATNTGTVDDLAELAAVCRSEGVRLHVDAAYGGFAVLDPEGARQLRGIGEADSVTLDPHKWLFQNYDCGCLMLRDPAVLERALGHRAEYLQDTETSPGEVNFGERGIQLSRRFRALGIWMTVRGVGRRGLAEAIGRGIDLAGRAEARIAESTCLELLHPARLGVVCYRYSGAGGGGSHGAARDEAELEALNRAIQDRLLAEGHAMVSSTRLRDRYALRLCILGHRSRWEHVREVLGQVERIGRELEA